jgi:3-oxoadipate enol-lactonase
MWGCGSSPQPPDDATTLDDFAAAVLRVLHDRGVETCTVVGLSVGGYVAFALMRQAAQNISALALCNTRATADTDAARADRLAMADRALAQNSVEFLVEPTIDRLVGPAARGEPHITDPLRGRIRRCTPAGIAFAQRAMASRPDSTPLLSQIRVPTLVVTGAEDVLVPPEQTRAMAAAIPGTRLVELPSGHLTNLENPPAFNELLANFLSSVPALTR